jgi:ABC-type glycerol-3-phosphate transport system permease component
VATKNYSPPPGQRALRIAGEIATYGILVIAVLFVLAPIAWGVSTSMKSASDIFSVTPQWIPPTVNFDNYLKVFSNSMFLRYIVNSVIVVVCALLFSTILAAHAAYAVSRFRFRGRDLLLFLVWATVMLPGVAIIVPLYLVAVDLGIYDTLFVVVLAYSAWLIPTLIWLLQGFVDAVPYELEEAAMIDGCSRLKAFYLIVLPLLRPGLAAAAVLVFVTIWNDFLLSFSLTLKDEHRLLQTGIYMFINESGIEWGPLTAAVIGSTVPVAIVFALLQRTFIRGLTGGAVKG